MTFSRLIYDSARRPATAVYLLLTTILGLPLITPLLRWTQVPCTHDGHLHYHRLAAMRYAWESGLPFSRWLPDVVFGYGYPFFNYREAAPLYVSLFPHLLGVPLPAAINLLYILGILAAGWFMFLWVRDVFGPLAGLVSAVAYMAAPYLLIDALVRGNQPESMGLALLPFIAWAGRRFVRDGKAWSFIGTSLGLALLAISHNISIFLFVPLLVVYLLAVGRWRRLSWRTLTLRLALVFGLGLGLAAFYTGPALLELDEITIRQSVSTRGNDFRFNFATLTEILAPVDPADPTLLNPPLLIRLGLAPVALGLLGLVSLIWTRAGERRGHIIFMGLSAVVMLFMALAISTPLWERIPLIEFVQFPWRLIGRAALPVAFLAGVPFSILAQRLVDARQRYFPPLLSTLAIGLILLEAGPILYPHLCREPARPSINDVHQYEHNTGLLGVDPAGSYFPKSALSRPSGSPLEADYQAGRIPQRFDGSVLPDGALLENSEYGPLFARVELTSPEAFQGRYLSYAFPGWRVRVNGDEVPIAPGDPAGLITFPVPAGASTIEIDWQLTPLRLAFSLLSVLALAAIVGLAWFLARRGTDVREERPSEVDQEGASAVQTAWLGVALIVAVALGFLAFKLLLVDRIESPLRRARMPDVSYPVSLTGAELRLAGYDLERQAVPAGDTFDIDLAWLVEAPPQADYQSNVWLRGPNGLTWSDKETQRPRIYEDTAPTRMWLPGQWAWDSREVQVLAGTPPGQYDIILTLFDLADLAPLTLIDDVGSVVGPSAVIGQIEVTLAEDPPELSPQVTVDEPIQGLTLTGYNQDRQEAIPGEPLLLTLFWRRAAGQENLPDRLPLDLVDESGRVVQNWNLAPIRDDYPPTAWPVEQELRGQHALRLAGGLDGGAHTLVLAGLPLGTLFVNAPERTFDEPAHQRTVGANFADQAELVGYTVRGDPEDPQQLTLTLIWRALAEMPVSYRVFVHLVDEAGEIVAQSDAEPVAWRRPTTSWAAGEYVIDEHNLQLPSGLSADELDLRIGLYELQSGQRLMVEGQDAFVAPLNGQ